MKAQRGFPQDLLNQCAVVPFGRCICGQAAARGATVFVNTVDERHETIVPNRDGHGHYCVPIMSSRKVLGVICVYVREGHKRDQKEEEFLVAVANTLAGLIERKRGEEALQRSKEVLELRVNERTAELMKAIDAREQEISERKRAQHRIRESLVEKEVLLSEIHHRVKNNMQVISSMLELQAEYITDPKYLVMFRDTQNRIQSMALIHEKLYQSKDLAHIHFNDYVQSLTESLMRSYQISNRVIASRLDLEDICLSIDVAIPCGLIINELIANSLQHAFPQQEEDGRKGMIRVSLHLKEDDMIELIVSDNGIGIPESIDFRNSESLGLQLVTNLTTYQLKGKIELLKGRGTTFKICFKRMHYAKRV
jgi:two-component sensor histidine kinase